MFKNTNSKKMTFILVALVLVTSLFIGGSIARYVTSTSSEDEARVAVWGINEVGPTTMDLFNAKYQLPDGTTIAQSNNSTDKIIAPGISNDHQFKIVNTDDTLAPEVMYEITINLDDSEIDQRILDNPSIQWRLDEGAYGTWEETKAKILALSGDASGSKVYAPGDMEHEFANGKTHSIGWTWLMDNGTDVEDTALGNAVANGEDITAKISINITARQVNVDATGMLDGNGSIYNTNDPQVLTFRADADYETFNSVKVDGTTINDSNYETQEGSIVVKLKKEYLANLEIGNHIISIVTDNKEIKSSFSVTDSMTIVHNGIIPEGGTYYVGVPTIDQWGTTTDTGDYTGHTNKYVAGDKFPTPQAGDIYVYGDYEYRYNTAFSFEDDTNTTSSWYVLSEGYTNDGWGVRVLDTTKSEYGIILSKINGKYIKNLDMAFGNCTNLIVAPNIPTTTESMWGTYINCTSLVTARDIPNSVTIAEYLFYNCSSLENPPELSNNVKDYSSAFEDCTSLIKMPQIPNGVERILDTFKNCSNLTETTTLPNSIKTMSYTFENCISLINAPTIPTNVQTLYATFRGCTKLSGTIEINSTPSTYPFALQGTQITEIIGSCSASRKEEILATK